MSTQIANNPPSHTGESKSARKKKAKAAEAVAAVAALQVRPDTPKARSTSAASQYEGSGKGGSDGGFESSYVSSLQKSIRNVNKKLTLMHKVDSIIAANPDKTLDELVASKTINADQKAQAQKKPQLIAQRTALEDQITQYKKIEAEHEAKVAKERSLLKSSHTKELKELRAVVRKEVELEKEKEFKKRMLVFARFLKAAAERRQREPEAQSEEGRAFESVLYGIYTGDGSAVDCAEKLISGKEENIEGYDGEMNFTFGRVKELMLKDYPIEEDSDEAAKAPSLSSEEASPMNDSDPTVTHAGLTELNTRIPNGTSAEAEPSSSSGPPNATLLGDAGNAAAEDRWDTKVPGEGIGMEESFEMVPRDPMETENREAHAPALQGSTQSWADETSAAAESGEIPNTPTTGGASSGDGFSEVTHSRGGRGGGRGSGHRGGGRGRGDGYRGRGRGEGGFRGEGRGRGRGGGEYRGRGGRGASSAPALTGVFVGGDW